MQAYFGAALLSCPVILLVSCICFSHADSLYFGRSLNLSNNSGASEAQNVAASGNSVYVVWQDNSTGNDEIYFTRSTDDGQAFGDAINLSKDIGRSESPQLIASGNSVYVVWQDNSTGNDEIYFKGSLKKGVSFRVTKNLSNDSGKSESPQLIASGNDTYIFWVNDYRNNSEILFKIGSTIFFRNLQNITSPGSFVSPRLNIQANNLFAVWESHSGYNKQIVLLPFPFSNRNAVIMSRIDGYATDPKIASSGSNVYVVWQDFNTPDSDIFFKKISSSFFERAPK
jgi:hypothetical protein